MWAISCKITPIELLPLLAELAMVYAREEITPDELRVAVGTK